MSGTEHVNPAARSRLDRGALTGEALAAFERMRVSPVKVLQIGEGNFLRGFVDWMLQKSRDAGLFDGSVAVTQPRPHGAAKLAELKRQDGLYYQLTRGIRDGKQVEERELVGVFGAIIDPYAEWESFLRLAEGPELAAVVSNTTEAGLTYAPSDWNPEQPVVSYPAKLTVFLYRRFVHFAGKPEAGLLLLPCELVDRNGDKLRELVLRHAADWRLPEAFPAWLREHNRFLNSLVDRIVTGYSEEAAEALAAELGVEDRLLNAAEPYHLWAIEGEPALDDVLPLAKAGLNVRWVNELAPYQLRKVRILNGAHTLLASLCLINGVNEVREAAEHPEYGPLLRRALDEEIVPSVPLPQAEMEQYAADVLERFRNPFIRHRLGDIAMNGLSKFRTRLLPTLLGHLERTGRLPALVTEALASLLRMYRARREGEGFVGARLDGAPLPLRDDAAALAELARLWSAVDAGTMTLERLTAEALGNAAWWERDLNEIPGLAQAVAAHLQRMETTNR